MKLKIIDASVAIKWFVDEPNRKEAMDLLSQIEQNPRQFGVPELFFNEMLSVFCKLALSEKEIVSFMHCLQNLGFHRIGN
ncbi:MAG: type II toxin-antitoxin system VapC family toxin, partial [Deltaproteobacteria bacterium]|nr:type II toxin-antitoxin system VapC family toxin [Deltaproteobacteria bacterium]